MAKDAMHQDDSLISEEKSRFEEGEGTTAEKKEPKKKAPLAKGDTRYVYLSMAVVLLMILTTAGIVIGFTFLFLSQEEKDEFHHGVSIQGIFNLGEYCHPQSVYLMTNKYARIICIFSCSITVPATGQCYS